MALSSIISLCPVSICVRRILLVSAALSLVYLGLSSFTGLPRNWRKPSSKFSNTIMQRLEEPKIHKKLKNGHENTSMEEQERLGPNSSRNHEELLWNFMEDDSSSLLETVQSSRPLDEKTLCPDVNENPLLVGHLEQASLLIEEMNEEEVARANPDLSPGGRWKPANCTARYKVGIVIPYRDRKSHLVRLLDFLIPVLKRQMLDFRFIVTEQKGDSLFNKGRIMNAAFRFGQRQLGLDCVVFHDVDMFPQDDRTPYGCPWAHGPRHVGAFVSNLGYQLWYQEIVGGVLAINIADYERVNGFSNQYWSWGGEDDDMGKRLLSRNFTIERPNSAYVRFTMLKHPKRKRLAPKMIYKLLAEVEKRMDKDGVREEDQWKISKVDVRPLYYHLLVDVGEPPDIWKS